MTIPITGASWAQIDARTQTLKRIKAEEVAAAYLKTGATPMPGEYYLEMLDIGLVRCCGLGVLALATHISKVRTLELSERTLYEYGFIRGFDGHAPCPERVDGRWPDIERCPADVEEYFTGYVDGVDAHLASLKAVGLLEDP